MSVASVLFGLVLAVVVYLVLTLVVASWLAAIVGVGVFVAMALGSIAGRGDSRTAA